MGVRALCLTSTGLDQLWQGCLLALPNKSLRNLQQVIPMMARPLSRSPSLSFLSARAHVWFQTITDPGLVLICTLTSWDEHLYDFGNRIKQFSALNQKISWDDLASSVPQCNLSPRIWYSLEANPQEKIYKTHNQCTELECSSFSL